MPNRYVYPTSSMSVGYGGGVIQLSPSDVWDADDPFVVARPELFGTDPAPTVVRRTRPAPVEQATANPGQARKTTRG